MTRLPTPAVVQTDPSPTARYWGDSPTWTGRPLTLLEPGSMRTSVPAPELGDEHAALADRNPGGRRPDLDRRDLLRPTSADQQDQDHDDRNAQHDQSDQPEGATSALGPGCHFEARVLQAGGRLWFAGTVSWVPLTARSTLRCSESEECVTADGRMSTAPLIGPEVEIENGVPHVTSVGALVMLGRTLVM